MVFNGENHCSRALLHYSYVKTSSKLPTLVASVKKSIKCVLYCRNHAMTPSFCAMMCCISVGSCHNSFPSWHKLLIFLFSLHDSRHKFSREFLYFFLRNFFTKTIFIIFLQLLHFLPFFSIFFHFLLKTRIRCTTNS